MTNPLRTYLCHLAALLPLLTADCVGTPAPDSPLLAGKTLAQALYTAPGICTAGDARLYDISGGIAVAVRPGATAASGTTIIDTDPAGKNAGYGWHAVAYPTPTAGAPALKTLVWLQGSGGKAYNSVSCSFQSQNILEEAIAQGYLVLQLGYVNADSVGSLCSGDPDCYGPVRQEIITGADVATQVKVDVANSVANRLQMLVDYIKAAPAAFPGLTLPAALAGATIDTSAVRFGGHSQGGGHVGWIAQHTLVEHACFLSAIVDNYVSGLGLTRSATWLKDPFTTPIGRFRDLYHVDDDAAAGIEANNQTMGLRASQVRSESYCPATGCLLYDPHSAIVNDDRYASDRVWACYN